MINININALDVQKKYWLKGFILQKMWKFCFKRLALWRLSKSRYSICVSRSHLCLISLSAHGEIFSPSEQQKNGTRVTGKSKKWENVNAFKNAHDAWMRKNQQQEHQWSKRSGVREDEDGKRQRSERSRGARQSEDVSAMLTTPGLGELQLDSTRLDSTRLESALLKLYSLVQWCSCCELVVFDSIASFSCVLLH